MLDPLLFDWLALPDAGGKARYTFSWRIGSMVVAHQRERNPAVGPVCCAHWLTVVKL
jgi:hypothetical protein